MALRPVRAANLTRTQVLQPDRRLRDATQSDWMAPPENEHPLRLRKRPLFILCLGAPLVMALGGFISSGARWPETPQPLSAPVERGALLARDGTVLAEGTAEARAYPQGRLAAQLIGFSGAEQPDGSYGLEGLERTLDSELQAGQDVRLTLDPALQASVQSELTKAATLHGAVNGAAVYLEAGTGRILATASYPEFDPNEQDSLTDRSVVRNSAYLAEVEPGSVMKPLVVAALLQDGKLKPNETLPVAETLQVGEKTFSDVTAHEPTLAVKDILRYSSNVGMIKIGSRFTSAELADWYRRYGFGKTANVAHVNESDGHINPPETWVPQDHASAVIGQSVSVTALQLAAAYSIFANDGRYITPEIVESEVDPSRARQVLSPTVARTVRDMLTYTVENSSLIDAKVNGVKVAGKSGSADLYDPEQGYIDAGTLSFAGIFPAENPKIIGVLYLQRIDEKGALSVSVTAPAFKAIGSQAAALWNQAELEGR